MTEQLPEAGPLLDQATMTALGFTVRIPFSTRPPRATCRSRRGPPLTAWWAR
jgi:hypothetical protein